MAGEDPERTLATDAFWLDYVAAGAPAGDYTVASFGDGAGLSTELLALVEQGRKRATASLLRDFENADQALPTVGDRIVCVDHRRSPRLIWQATDVEVKPMIEVDDAFAWDEGEGDRTRADWLAQHRRYFERQAAREGWRMTDREPVVFERFRVVWPPEWADA